MNVAINYLVNSALSDQITEHLLRCDAKFVLALSKRIVITEYAQKISNKAMRFEAWSGVELIGLIAVYCNDREAANAHITSVSVIKEWAGKGIASQLMTKCIGYVKAEGMHQVSLEVATDNKQAIDLYQKNGFLVRNFDTSFIQMILNLKMEKL